MIFESMNELLSYWFEYCPSNIVLAQRKDIRDSFDRWFGRKEDVRQHSIWNTSVQEVETWGPIPNGQLAKVILYDQIARGCFRGTPSAFAYEEQALSAANQFLDCAYPYVMDVDAPICLSHTFMALICLSHSENRDIQQRSLDLSAEFANEVLQQNWLSETTKQQLAQVYPEAQQHYNVIHHLGRFPHRNRILDRVSTLEEKRFLSQENLPRWMYSQ
jgi:uncharacterized protein (DUF924 family)